MESVSTENLPDREREDGVDMGEDEEEDGDEDGEVAVDEFESIEYCEDI